MEIAIPFLFLWITLSIVTGIIGSSREIGFIAFLLSFFFSPLVGLIIVFDSRKKTIVEHEHQSIENQKKIIAMLEKLYEQTKMNKIDQDDL